VYTGGAGGDNVPMLEAVEVVIDVVEKGCGYVRVILRAQLLVQLDRSF